MTNRPDATKRGRGTVRSGLAFLTLLGGCTLAPPAVQYLPPPPAIVDVVQDDHRFSIKPKGEIPSGRAVFRVHNRGQLTHDLSLVPLPEDMAPINDQLRSGDRRATPTLVRRPSHPPGGGDIFAVDLRPGRYALLCFETDGTGDTPHALVGMAVEFRVTSSSGGAGS